MSTRLSKFQKWILQQLYLRKVNSLFPNPEITRQEILAGFYKWKKRNRQELGKSIYLIKNLDVRDRWNKENINYMKKQVALSNSLKNLIKKGWIKAVGRQKENLYFGEPTSYFPVRLENNKLTTKEFNFNRIGNLYSNLVKIYKVRLTKKGEEIVKVMKKKVKKTSKKLRKKEWASKLKHKKLTDF